MNLEHKWKLKIDKMEKERLGRVRSVISTHSDSINRSKYEFDKNRVKKICKLI
jgi:hypothetical protein